MSQTQLKRSRGTSQGTADAIEEARAVNGSIKEILFHHEMRSEYHSAEADSECPVCQYWNVLAGVVLTIFRYLPPQFPLDPPQSL